MIKYDFFYDSWYDLETQQILASMAIGLMYYRLFTWMRIYEPTAFFLRLLKMTLLDAKSFSIMLLAVITAFANVMYILNSKRLYNDEEQLYDSVFENGFISSWIA